MNAIVKVYRYTTRGEGVFSAGKRLLPSELVEEANQNRTWLQKPALGEGVFRFWLTPLGRDIYEKTLLKTHTKYLSDIILEEKKRSDLGDIFYEDKHQVVEKLEIAHAVSNVGENSSSESHNDER